MTTRGAHEPKGTKVPEDSSSEHRKNISVIQYLIFTEKATAPHSSTLAWKTPWMEGPDGLQSTGLLGVGHD